MERGGASGVQWSTMLDSMNGMKVWKDSTRLQCCTYHEIRNHRRAPRNNKMIILFNKYHTWRDRTTSVSSYVMSPLHQRFSLLFFCCIFFWIWCHLCCSYSFLSPFLPCSLCLSPIPITVHWQVCLRVACVPCVSLRSLRIPACPWIPCVSCLSVCASNIKQHYNTNNITPEHHPHHLHHMHPCITFITCSPAPPDHLHHLHHLHHLYHYLHHLHHLQ